MSQRALQIHPDDTVAVALEALPAGDTLTLGTHTVTLAEAIDPGHKFALIPMAEGAPVVKYGCPIGHATAAIAPGAWVHVHNVRTNLSGTLTYAYDPKLPASAPAADTPTFQGYVRADGSVGIRNEIWIVPTVGCVNGAARALARMLERELPPGVDGVQAWEHPYGCSQLGADHVNTQKALAGLVRHPNAGGVLILGLGCENNTMAQFRDVLGEIDETRVRTLITQEVEDELEVGMTLLRELAVRASGCVREAVPAGKLVVGLKCGASDGLSGITGNPLVGVFSDMLIAHGGISILTEVPEMFGAETLLMDRCRDEATFEKCVQMVNGFKEYFQRYNQVVYENPSPGNKAGGITTLEDKSLGCTQKGGTGIVTDVLGYGDRARVPGLNLLDGPGNDIVACTALAASGAHMVLFTTGRGTPLGGPVPTVKISTNTPLATRKANWIDYNAGVLVEGATMEEVAGDFFRTVLAVASGQPTRNEVNGFREIAIFKDGVTL